MTILYFTISVTLILWSLFMLLKQLQLREIAYFDLIENPKSFNIAKTGIYSVSIVGINPDFNLKNLQASLKSLNGVETLLSKNKIRFAYLRKGTLAVEQWKFITNETGKYELYYPNLNQYLAENPKLISKKLFSNRQIETKSLKIAIKQSVPLAYRLFSLLGLFFGISGLSLGVFFAMNI